MLHRSAHLLLPVLAFLSVAGPGRAQEEAPLSAENGWFVVPVTVNDTLPLRFVLDTGAALSAVSRTTAERLGLPSGDPVVAQGASGPQRLGTVRLETMAVGRLEAWNRRVLVLEDRTLTPQGGREAGFTPYDGVLGADFFGRFDVLIDPLDGVFRLYSPGTPPSPGALPPLAEPIPLRRIAGPILGHDVVLNGVTVPAILDTGARRVVVSPRGARVAGITPIEGTARVAPAGVGTRQVRVEDARVDSLRAGTTALTSVPAEVGALPIFRTLGFGDRSVILLGSPVFRECPVLISYTADTIRYCRDAAGR
ncbi:MAG: aspartyl protease family protein [Gemmatimonadales bacterium]|nr:MAG: aspartyl protease family protein [Gemmatimonadales bacterium]